MFNVFQQTFDLNEKNSQKKELFFYDPVLLFSVFILIGIGSVMVFSSTIQLSLHSKVTGSDPFYFLRRHIIIILLSFCALFGGSIFNKKFLSFLSISLPIISVVLLLLVLSPLGVRKGIAQRWLNLFGLIFQPGEIAKVAFVLYIARFLAKKHDKIKNFFAGLLPLIGTYLIIAGLFLAQPDIGSALLLGIILALMIFIAGTRFVYIGVTIVFFVLSFVVALLFYPERFGRIIGWLIPWIVRSEEGFQIVESHITMGNGYIFGAGLGSGLQNIGGFLPESHTDFIISIIGEELGFFAVFVIIILFTIIFWRSFRIAYKTDDEFIRYLSIGLTLVIIIPALIHMAVAIGLLPTKGLCLPYVSYGGTSMFMSCFAVGIIQRLYKETYLK